MYFIENIMEHRFCKTAGLSVIAAAMIGIHQPSVRQYRVYGPMSKGEILSFTIQRRQDCLVGNPAKRKNGLAGNVFREFRREKRITHPYLIRGGFIVRRQAFDGIRDPAVDQHQAIVFIFNRRLIAEAEFE